MRIFILFLTLFFGFHTETFCEEEDPVPEEREVDSTIWIGPGWYGGVFFGTEIEFNDYHSHHHKKHHDGRRDHHRDHHRRGGGHGRHH